MSSEQQHDAGPVPPEPSSPAPSSGPSTPGPGGTGPRPSRRRMVAATLLATLSLGVVALLTPWASAATTTASDGGAAARAAAASRSAAASSSAAARRSSAAAPTTTVRPTTAKPTTTAPKPTTTAPKPTTTTPRPTTTTAAPTTTTTAPPTTAPANDMLAQVLAITNQERAKAGCGALTRNAQLDSAAQQHSDYQAQTQTMSHTGRGGTDPGQRITAAGYQWSTYGENVAYGFTTAQDVMTAWMNSPGHRANILNCNFKEIGLGLGQPNYYWTQDFATKR